MAIICKLINATTGGVLNKDSDIQALAHTIMNEGVIADADTSDFEVTAGQVGSGRALIEVTRTNTTPEEKFMLYVWNQQDEAKTLGSNKKIFIKVPLDNINDNTLNTNPTGSGIATIEVEDAYPVSDYYLSLAETDAGGNITDTRTFTSIKGALLDSVASSDIAGGNWKVFYTNGSGVTTELALGAATKVLTSNGATSAPSFESPVIDMTNVATRLFGGTGADGVQADADLTITGSNNTIITKNFSSWTAGSVARTCTITPTGCITYIKISGDADFTNWTFNFAGKGMPGGAKGVGGINGGANPTAGTRSTPSALFIVNTGAGGGGAGVNGANGVGGGGGGGGSGLVAIGSVGNAGGTGGTAGTAGTRPFYYGALTALQSNKYIPSLIAQGGGGGGGGSARTGTGNGTDGGAGGAGGGTLIIEVNGNLTLATTAVTVAGVAGDAGGDTTHDRGCGGGGGGGGGGLAIILYNGTLTGSVTPTITAGAGGAGGKSGGVGTNGGDGGAGSAGLYLIEKNTTFN